MSFSFYNYSTAQSNFSRGFTLLELAIVMSILGLLTASAVGLYGAMSKRNREFKTKDEMENIREAVLGYYRNYLVLPSPESGYVIPIDDLELPPTAQKDEIYKGKYYAYIVTNAGSPFTELVVDGKSIGGTAMVLISSGADLTFEEENTDLGDGEYSQEGTGADFDDILIYLSGNELGSAIAWRREIEEEAAVLNQAARILAENDDDGDGYVDEDSTDPSGNSDGYTDWGVVNGTQSLVNAGLLWNADHVVDSWGIEYRWDSLNHKFYSAGPNKTDEGCGGDDICP